MMSHGQVCFHRLCEQCLMLLPQGSWHVIIMAVSTGFKCLCSELLVGIRALENLLDAPTVLIHGGFHMNAFVCTYAIVYICAFTACAYMYTTVYAKVYS